MMSILIKNMKMPTTCEECPCWWVDSEGYIPSCCQAGSKYEKDSCDHNKQDTLPDDCPLVELPEPHGRLIDGDELFKQMNTAIAMMSGMMKAIGAEDDEGMQMELKAYRDIRDGIKDYDTVIEAEGKEC